MSIEWINRVQFMQNVGIDCPRKAKRWMSEGVCMGGKYKGQRLITRTAKLDNGQNGLQVLWNTETNSPAEEQPISPSSSVCVDSVEVLSSIAAENAIHDTVGSYFFKESSNDNQTIESPVSVQEPDTTPDVKKEFERLLNLKLINHPNKASAAVLRRKYRKEFEETGDIPLILIEGNETRGAKSQLKYEVVNRFEELIRWSVELNKQGHPNVTQPLRKVANFHAQMQEEMKLSIDIRKLYRWLENRADLREMLKKPDAVEAKKSKNVSYFASVPVFDLIQMDGVQTDFIALGSSLNNYRFIDCIEFFDLGSRRLMAIRGYFGESNENSVDIFNRFLSENEFPKKHIRLRPDNAKGFLNLKRCISEINKHHALPDGFTLIDDYARAGTPTDKAQLESSHRAFHNREHKMINKLLELYPDSLVGTIQKRKKISENLFKPITVKVFDLTVEQFNESGVLQAYQDWHNNFKHSFQVDGKRDCRWQPSERYQEFLQTQATFRFATEDLERNIVYGGRKEAYKVTKDGLINYQSKKYGQFSVELPEKFSTTHSVDVKVTLVSAGKLAVFNAAEDGEFICYAYALKAPAPEIADKVVEKLEAKARKQAAKGSTTQILKLFEEIGLPADTHRLAETELQKLIAQGLTIELTALIIQNDNTIRYGDGSERSNNSRWMSFWGAAGKRLKEAQEQKFSSRNTKGG